MYTKFNISIDQYVDLICIVTLQSLEIVVEAEKRKSKIYNKNYKARNSILSSISISI